MMVLLKDLNMASGQKFQLRMVKTVKSGCGPGHQRKGLFGSVSCKEANALQIEGVAGDHVYLEAENDKERKAFVLAAVNLLDVAFRFPTKVRPALPNSAAAEQT